MSKGRSKAPSQRQLRVGEELRHILAHALERGQLNDPLIQDVLITITEVEVSPDLKSAAAYVIPLGGDIATMNGVIEGLNRASPYLRRILANKLYLRHTPRLSFLADTTLDQAHHIEELLREPAVARDIEAKDDVI